MSNNVQFCPNRVCVEGNTFVLSKKQNTVLSFDGFTNYFIHQFLKTKK
jgi:hypothetical protein